MARLAAPLLVAGLALALGGRAHALAIPPRPQGPINDYARVLSPDAVARLTQQLRSYELGSTRQICVAIFPSLEGEALEDFSIRLAEAWKIGSRKSNDGVLVTLFIAEHRDRIDVGYGLEGQLTDALASRIQHELMEPRFKAGDFEGGLRAGLAAIDTATGGHQHPEGQLAARGKGDQTSPLGVLVFLVFLGLFVYIGFRNRRGGGGGGIGFIGGGGGWSSSSGWSSGGGGGGGGSSWSGGGGSFGGGGSSGSW